MRKLFLIMMTLMAFSWSAMAQTHTVTGEVVQASDGDPIVGASVMAVGSSVGTATDIDGRFTLNVPSTTKELQVSYIGMHTLRVKVDFNSPMKIRLSSSASDLDEVVVVAYGTAKKSSLTGAVSSISGADIEKLSVSNVSKALEGSVPGVQTASISGQPGSGASVRIRGIGSINSSSAPLYVVDGIPFEGNIESINPADIESMNVLKDAASTALYGARAANGVILITTKRGSSNRSKVTLDVRLGQNSRGVPSYDVMTDPGMYMKTYWTMLRNGLGDGAKASAQLFSDLGYNPYDCADNEIVDADGNLTNARLLWNDSWQDETVRNGFRQEYNLTVSGGNERSSHFLSLGYLNDEGIIRNSDYSRLSIRANGNYDVNRFLTISGNVAYARGEQKQQSSIATEQYAQYSNPFSFMQQVAPIYPVYLYDRNGNRVKDDEGNDRFDFGDGTMGARAYAPNQNPVASTEANRYVALTDNVSTRAAIILNIWDGLKFQANGGYDVMLLSQNQFTTGKFGDGQTDKGRATKYRKRMETYTVNELLTYNKEFGAHTVDALIGHENYYYSYNQVYNYKTGLFDPDLDEFDNAINMKSMNSYTQEQSIESVFGRINYSYDNRYYASFSLRGDGSSRFAPGKRWGTFWSVGASWRLSNEKFMESSRSWLNNASIRASYGSVGNDAILDADGYANYYPYLTQYAVVNNNGDFSLTKIYQGNPNLTWETSYNLNLGVSATLFDNLLNIDFEYFNKRTEDMLYNVPQPPSSGISYISENAMTMTNSGIEFTLGVNIPMPRDFRLGFTFTGTHYRNKVSDIPEAKRKDGITRGNFNIREGRSVYDYYMYEFAGLDENGKQLFYKDVTDDKGNVTGRETINDYSKATKYYVGTAIPDFLGGLQMDFGWKGIDFSMGMNYQLGGKVMDSSYQNLMGTQAGFNFHKDILNSWTPENKNTTVPFLTQDQNINTTSSRWLTSANFFNLRNITLGYSFPAEWLRTAGIEKLRIYVTADNIALCSKRKGLDPRQYISGSQSFSYSQMRTVAAGVQVTF